MPRSLPTLAVMICITTFPASASAQSRSVFAGIPNVKISEAGLDRVVEKLAREKAVNLACVISEIDGRLYWASRGNEELRRSKGGAFVTYFAVDGSGYVRVVQPQFKDAAALGFKPVASFDYVEHLLTGLGSVTYYGVRRAD